MDNYERIRSLSLIFIREHEDFRGAERNLVRREMFDRAMSWIDNSCRESLAPDSPTIGGSILSTHGGSPNWSQVSESTLGVSSP